MRRFLGAVNTVNSSRAVRASSAQHGRLLASRSGTNLLCNPHTTPRIFTKSIALWQNLHQIDGKILKYNGRLWRAFVGFPPITHTRALVDKIMVMPASIDCTRFINYYRDSSPFFLGLFRNNQGDQ